MRLFDLHSHWGTQRGYVLRSPEAARPAAEDLELDTAYDTEDEMAAYFRANGVRTILDFGFTKIAADRRDRSATTTTRSRCRRTIPT